VPICIVGWKSVWKALLGKGIGVVDS